MNQENLFKSLETQFGWKVVGFTKDGLIGYYRPSPNIESAAQEVIPQSHILEIFIRKNPELALKILAEMGLIKIRNHDSISPESEKINESSPLSENF